MTEPISEKNLQEHLKDKQLYIWGSGHLGVTLLKRLLRQGITVTAYLDSTPRSAQVSGYPVLNADTILQNPSPRIFIIIAAALYEAEIAGSCQKYGLTENQNFIRLSELKPYHFEIDVAGVCNLRCATCPRGNSPVSYNDGLMSLDTYRMTLDKILQEYPFLPDIQLYSWGEPLLNRDLASMIRYTNDCDVSVAISSNLSLTVNLETIVKAQPQWFRISASGFGERYPVMHKGGRWDLVYANMQELARCRDLYAPQMIIELNYHIYKHNIDDIRKMQDFCAEHGFLFQANFAFIDPLDLLLEYRKTGYLPQAVQETCNQLMISLEDACKEAERQKDAFCPCINNICISADLRVMNCSHLFNPECNTMSPNFLEIPFAELHQRMRTRSACTECRSYSLNSFYNIYLSKGVSEIPMNDKDAI